jgi:IclR family KDG regulon transcriptional repressor
MRATPHLRQIGPRTAHASQTTDHASRYLLASVSRPMRMLECFSSAAELRLTDLSARLGIPKPQALRIALTLVAGGYLARDPVTKRFRLGIQLFHLGMLVRQHMDLQRIARPHLQRLVDQAHETARLVVPDDAGPVCIDLVESPRSIRVFAQLGTRMPWNAGASPRLILAFLPDDERRRILAHAKFQRFTQSTVTSPAVLEKQVLAIRRRGVSIAGFDLDADAIGVSAPVFDHDGTLKAAVNVSGPASRLSKRELARLAVLVRRAADEISRELGYRPPPIRVRRKTLSRAYGAG